MLTDYTVEPASGNKPECLVIFFHGYGSSAALMADYAGKLLGPLLPEARLRFPDAPLQLGWDNHSWFDVQDMLNENPGPDKDIVAARARAAAKDVNDYIDRVIAEDGISSEKVIIAGFSQGGTMAYYAGLLRDSSIGGVFSLSGGALEKLEDPKSRPPVALLAGAREEHDYSGVPQVERASSLLAAKGFAVETFILPEQGHQITPAAMAQLSGFSRKVVAGAFEASPPAASGDGLKSPATRPVSGPRP